MNFSKPIYWRQGIFLQPQHFQYGDAYHDEARTRLFDFTHLKGGGVVALKFSPDRLQSGFLACGELQALMPDGQWVDIRLNARLPDRDIRTLKAADGTYKVAVGLPQMNPGTPAVATQGLDGRFETVGYSEDLPDLFDDTPDLEVDRLWMKLRFLVGDEIEAAQEMTVLQIARIVVEAGSVSFDEAYAPPCFLLDEQSTLAKRIRLIMDGLQARATRLTDMARPWRMDGEPVDPAWLRDRMVHAEVGQCLIELEHRVQTRVPPERLFEALLVLCQRLSALGGLKGPDLPSWDRDDPYRAFDRVGIVVQALLEQLHSGPDSVALFKAREGWLEAQVPSAARVGEHSVYLVLQQVSETQLLQASPAKLASLARIETVVSRALPGAPLERLERVPYGLSESTQAGVWRIDTSDPLWKEANASGTICLHWLGLPKSSRALLVYYRA
ncbi:COG3522 Predicted component of the type VI protein secretion system [Burkholderiaceae bacterium]|jgi:type VI secretion system protein ImpJ